MPYYTSLHLLRFETFRLQLAATKHHHESRPVANYVARIALVTAHLVIKFVVGVRRLLTLQVQLQVAVGACRSETRTKIWKMQDAQNDSTYRSHVFNYIKKKEKKTKKRENRKLMLATHSPFAICIVNDSSNSSRTRSRCCESCIP